MRLFICALWSHAGKGLTSWLSFVMYHFPLGIQGQLFSRLYRFLIFAPLLTNVPNWVKWVKHDNVDCIDVEAYLVGLRISNVTNPFQNPVFFNYFGQKQKYVTLCILDAVDNDQKMHRREEVTH